MRKEKCNFQDLKEVKIISTGYTRPGCHNAQDEVNRLLCEGWQLLETYITCYSNTPPLTSQQEIHFVLGRKDMAQPDQLLTVLQA